MSGIAISNAHLISQCLFELVRPPSMRDAMDVSTYLLPVLVSPQTGDTALYMDDGDTLTISANCDINNIEARCALLRGFDVVTLEESTAIVDYIAAHIGQEVLIDDLIPARYPRMTQEQMEADGWFNYGEAAV